MRKLIAAGLGLGALVLFAGCPNWIVPDPNKHERLPMTTPTAEQLVTAMNANARKVPILEVRDLDIDCKADGMTGGLLGKMVCQKPRNFYLQGRLAGKPAVQIGSNDTEFWYWISEVKPTAYVFHCTHEDYKRGRAQNMQIPFQPEWIVDALGIGTYDERAAYRVATRKDTIELEQDTVSPSGQPLRKVTVFNRAQVGAGRYSPIAHLLLDKSGQQICAAHITHFQTDARTGAVLPKRIQLEWPAEKISMTLKLDGAVVLDRIEEQRATVLFNRQSLANLPGYNLASGPDAAGGGVRQAGGSSR